MNVHQPGGSVWRGTVGYNWDLGPGHVSFSNPVLGARAGALNLITKIQNGQDTIRSIIFGQSGRDNAYTGRVSDQPYYAQAIADATGISLDQKLNASDSGQLLSLMRAMTQYENSVVPTNFNHVASEGLRMAYDYKGINDSNWDYRSAPSDWPAPFLEGSPPSDFLTGNFPDYGELSAWGTSMAGWPSSPTGEPSVGGNMELGGYGGAPPATGFEASLGQPLSPYSAPFGGWDYSGGGAASAGGNMSLGDGNLSPGPAISAFQDLWTPVNYGSQGSASQGGNAISGFGGNMSPGPAVLPFQDLWSPGNFAAAGGGNMSQGGNMSLGGNNFGIGDYAGPFQDLWTPIDFGPGGSASVGGNMELGGAGVQSPRWSGDLFDPNIYAGGGDGGAISTFGGLNDPASFDPGHGAPNYSYNADGTRDVYDANWNWLGRQTPGGEEGGSRTGSSEPGGSPILDLSGLPMQNLSMRPLDDIAPMPFGPGQTTPYLNAQGEVVMPSGTGFGYSPTAVYNAQGQYIGANSGGFFGNQGSAIGGIMGSGNSWNTMSQGSSGGGPSHGAQTGGLGGDQASSGGAGEFLGGVWEDVGGGKVAWMGGYGRGSRGAAGGRMGHLAPKVF